ncbi:outer membrane efflux protein [Candidatus Magnetobacterium bavaricum]|uniref:Outer membrane efflux protein n=1 Tax=Candidatus Magnetobacterium bavaricum TaxID=29290 RepID=A0A0F3GU38_9BACT|nr:outer membrane efflux protein [Candidatus Magnetobacterium bavaricum]
MLFVAIVMMIPLLCYGADIEVVDVSKEALTITEGLGIAIEHGRVVSIASHNVAIASSESDLAQAAMRPSVDISAGHSSLYYQPSAIFNNNTVNMTNKSSFFYGVTVKQTIYDFGTRLSRYDESLVAIGKAMLDVDRVKNVVALSYLLACFELLETDSLISVALREAEQLQAHAEVTRTLYNEGVVTRNDTLAADVRLADARERLLSLKNLRTLNASRINYFLTRPLNDGVSLIDDSPQPPPLQPLEVYLRHAHNQRIELKMADRQIHMLQLQSKAKTASYYPRFYVQGGFNYTENRYQVHEDNWSAVLGAELNIFDGGATRAEVSKISHKVAQVSEERRKITDDISLEVQKGYLDTKTASERVKVTGEAIAHGQENLRINRVRYEEGQGSATDVLDAIALLTLTQSNYYRAMFDLKRAYATLLYAAAIDIVSDYVH